MAGWRLFPQSPGLRRGAFMRAGIANRNRERSLTNGVTNTNP